ncbi:uncharacterized protein N7482_001476 [Penicillium canariense]|uniref:Uncharacterized protein n=1 Tax=Penicillium canariense TaxID=189055 RepID=A0A9W9IDG4_9EURO|nr:uncharacterized protein N7482_001476 [Penicillium canariense]KAJ5175599.1 hypothetical protein N7482_001476 [Penicillium canariense]
MAVISLPPGFQIEPVQFIGEELLPIPSPLGVLANFNGSFTGTGFNTIFRPHSGENAVFPRDNILELNLIDDAITFSEDFGAVPNRGLQSQSNIILNGVSYVQAVNDVTNEKTGMADNPPTGIHFETGLWMNVPATNNTPVLGESLVRMGSIPHGTTINAQCLAPTSNFSGPPDIPAASLAVFPIGDTTTPVPIGSTNASVPTDLRRPQDLSKFIAAGTITQEMLDDPNTVLRNAIEGQTILQNIAFTVSTMPSAPVFGGGTANIAFLEGNPLATTPNANAVQMNATFWIETVQHELKVPMFKLGQAPMKVSPDSPADRPVPVFLVNPPHDITAPRTINVTSIQIQYSQVVLLVFDLLVWPHYSVSTLVPSDPVTVPDSVWN